MWEVICADVLEWCKNYTGEPFHAILCDPPYGLEFMGKEWDAPWKYKFAKHGYTDGGKRVAAPNFSSSRNPMCRNCHRHIRGWKGVPGCQCESPDPDTWDKNREDMQQLAAWYTQCFAALAEHLLPGGFVMAFASSRGWHRLACAMEDAGLIIQPSIFGWLNGQSFPKATRIDTQIDKRKGYKPGFVHEVQDFLNDARKRKGLTYKELNRVFGFPDDSGMAGHWCGDRTQPMIPRLEYWPKLKELLNLDDSYNEAIEAHEREVIGNDKARSAETWFTAEEWDITAPATDLARAWEGHRYGGQILKNALEPIVLAMKPLTIWQKCGTLVEEITSLMEVFLCQFINVKAAERILREVEHTPNEASESSVALSTFLIQSALNQPQECDQMDMWQLSEGASIPLNIASLWNDILGVPWSLGSSYTTSMEIQAITVLKTLKSWLLANTLSTIIQAVFSQSGENMTVQTAAKDLNASDAKFPQKSQIVSVQNDVRLNLGKSKESERSAKAVGKNSLPGAKRKQPDDVTVLLAAIAKAKKSKVELIQLARCAESLLEGLLGQLRTSSITNAKSVHGENRLEPIIVAQKPWEGKRLDCIVETGAGALWVDGGRINSVVLDSERRTSVPAPGIWGQGKEHPQKEGEQRHNPQGRWPSNFALCHSEGCERAKSKSDNFPYSFKDSVRIPIIYDSVNSDTLPKKLFVNFSVTWLSSCSVMVGGIIYFNGGIEMGEIEINNEAPLLSNSDPLMLKLDSFFTQLIGDFKLNFWNGEGFPTDKTFTAMNGKFEAISLSASDLTNIGTEDFSLSSFDSPRMGFKFFAADRTDAGDFVSSVSNLEFIRTFLATRFPGRFDRKSFFDDCNELRFADGADSFDFAHWTPPGGIIQQQSSTVKVDAWECVEGCPVARLDKQAGERKSGGRIWKGGEHKSSNWRINEGRSDALPIAASYSREPSTGTATRFFKQADWSYEITKQIGKQNKGDTINDSNMDDMVNQTGSGELSLYRDSLSYRYIEVAERIATSDPVRYCPKAARRERNQNLDDFYWRKDKKAPIGFVRIDKDEWETLSEKERAQGSIHPTCKPISLNKWLATLLLPPNEYAPRRILIPFFGSGSEGIGAGLAGWEEIVGIDSERDYCDIAKARLNHWLNRPKQLELP